MAHELEILENGQASMMYFGATPWHGLGVQVLEAPNSEQALIAASLDWKVRVQQLYVINHETKKPVVLEDNKANVRQSDMSVLGVVGSQYKPIQNDEAFSFMDSLIGEGLTYETAGSLRNGKQIFLTAKLPDQAILGDAVTPYIVMTNSHDGSSMAKILLTPTRVVCMNTLNMAISDAVRSVQIRHIGNLDAKMEEAKRVLGITTTYMKELEKEADKLAMVKLSDKKIESIINEIIPIPENASDDKQNVLYYQRENVKKCLSVDNLADYKNTGWGLINAVADFTDHYNDGEPTQRQKEIHFQKVVKGHDNLEKTRELILASA